MRLGLIIFLLSISTAASAAELSKVTAHENGWAFLFLTSPIKSAEFPEGHRYSIELPFNKCTKTDVAKECFATKREVTNAAWAKAKAAEKMMKTALSKN